ncbi:MAG: methylmalonyl-CoA mutase family protein [Deltaproteobacteria bacterium]
MKPLDLNFPDHTKDEWLKLIAGSLKSGSLDDFIWKLDDKVYGEPFAHYEDLKRDYNPIFSHAKDNNWLTGIDYSLVSNDIINGYFKQHVRFGLESFMIYASESNIDFESVFKGVELDKYDILLNTRNGMDTILFMEHLKDYCISRNYNHKKLKFNLRIPDDRPEEMLELYRYLILNFPELRFFFRTERELSYFPAQYLTETFNNISDFIRDSELPKDIIAGMMKRWKVHFFMTENFLSDIAMLRAFKIVWANYLKILKIENSGDKIILGINHDAYTDSENNDLVVATIISMAGAIAGVHSINIAPKETGISDLPEFMRHLLNIQNIMKHESNINLIKDAVAGSYALETASSRIAEEAWSNLI